MIVMASAIELPPELSVSLTIKIDQPYSITRAIYDSPVSLTLVVDERYEIFHAKAREKISAMKKIVWPDDAPILLRSTASTHQTNYEPLAQAFEDFHAQFQQLWKLAARRKQG